jgi:hypothetical protein
MYPLPFQYLQFKMSKSKLFIFYLLLKSKLILNFYFFFVGRNYHWQTNPQKFKQGMWGWKGDHVKTQKFHSSIFPIGRIFLNYFWSFSPPIKCEIENIILNKSFNSVNNNNK